MSHLAMLILATTAFVGTHLLMSHPLRPGLVSAMGEKGFLGLYSLVSFATLGWMVLAARAMPAEAPLWPSPPALWSAAGFLMLLAAILLVGSLIGNPALPAPEGKASIPAQARGIFAVTRHPMMWSFILWALVHALVWSTPRTLVIAAGIGLLALVGAAGQDAKKLRLIGEPWRQWCRRTSFLPFAALIGGRVSWAVAWPGALPLLGGLGLWLLATWLHPLAGAPVVPPWSG